MSRILILVIIISFCYACTTNLKQRDNICLNGKWEIEECSTNKLPEKYNHQVMVPGLVDMANPLFDSAGYKYSKRNFYCYRRTFSINRQLPPVVFLKVSKAIYGTRVFINSKEAGYNPFGFTPTLLNIRDYLNAGKPNEIIIQLGAYTDNIPDSIPRGKDFEKIKYTAGIYDNVELILSGYPFIQNIQIVPDIRNQLVRVVAEIISDKKIDKLKLVYAIHESKSGKAVYHGNSPALNLLAGENKYDFQIPLKNCHLWSPEDPFLYNLNLSTGKDSKTEHFGMRSFRFNKEKKMAMLNDKPYPMLGTNVCIFRFFEDPSRDSLPWNKDWVRKLHLGFKSLNWTSIRYCIGFPPEIWYDIADETGFLIQDEYPLWGIQAGVTREVLIDEYTRWMRERWNHPSVVIWDAQNETVTEITGQAINKVRNLDLSDRPWDNGYSPPQSENDCIESHPYLFVQYHPWGKEIKKEPSMGYMKDFFDTIRLPDNDPNQQCPGKDGRYNNPVIVNEYDWLWINRDASPTTLTEHIYKTLFGLDTLTEKQIRIIHAENIGYLTEYWRCHRSCAALMHFCGLGYSRTVPPRGQTSDNFIDIKNLVFDPWFFNIVRSKFLPLCIMIDKWDKEYPSKSKINIPVYVINDMPADWAGSLSLSLIKDDKTMISLKKVIIVKSLGRNIVNFSISIPENPGKAELVSELFFKNDTVRSIRKFKIGQ